MSKSDMKAKKILLRKEILARRDDIDPTLREQKSTIISEKLFTFINKPLEGKRVAVYSAMNSEVSLDFFIQKAYRSGACLCFPCMIKPTSNTSRMQFLQVNARQYADHNAPFVSNPLRFFTPHDPALQNFPLLAAEKIDIAIIPLVAFDTQGNRLGYGGGNYDRFLPCLQSNVLIVGVAFEEQRMGLIPTEEHDTPLPHIISA